MLFNSYPFIFLFLPLALLGYYGLRRYFGSGNSPMAFLVLASLFFYGWWEPLYLLVILASILANYWIGRQIILHRQETTAVSLTYLVLGITLNLLALGYFKYTTFILINVQALTGADIAIYKVVLPLAISFFTFQQIAYLVDAYKGECADYDFVHYCLFVTFFPQLIAGPIVHHSEMMPQFLRQQQRNVYEDFYIGISFFVLGLTKKVLLADSVAEYATPVFSAADAGTTVNSVEAWGGTIAYSLQLYFDFSGYADMAIGAARMFGIQLPLNFNSPYKATSIIDFWRRWHMTLSRFLRDYLYIPLGGNRHGPVARHRNLLITMLLGGLWHGAGWNFIIWGGLHGSYLVINHLFLHVRLSAIKLPQFVTSSLAWLITALAVTLAWVFFRAETLPGALHILQQMFSSGTADYGTAIWLEHTDRALRWIVALLIIALCFPNTQQILGYLTPQQPLIARMQKFAWRPSLSFAALCLVLLITALFNMLDISPFLYFQF